MGKEVVDHPELTPEQWREMSARFAGRRVVEDEDDQSESREEPMTDVVGQMRANKMKAAPTDAAKEAARLKIAATQKRGTIVAELIELSKKVEQGDRKAQERVIWLLDRNPDIADFLGDLSRRAEEALIGATSGGLFAVQLARARHAEAMRQELLSERSTPLEKMAAQNVVASWLQIQVIDENFASAAKRGIHLSEWTKLQERAAKRYQNALKSLELAAKASQSLGRSSSSVAAAPIAATPTKATAGKVRVRSMPAKKKSVATVAEKPSVDCSEQQHCETPARPPRGPIRTTRMPANRVAEFVGASGAPPSSNGHANHEPPSAVGVLNGK